MEFLQELKWLVDGLDVKNSVFRTNHASNYLPIKVRFPEGKEPALALIQKALQGKVSLRPEWMRAL